MEDINVSPFLKWAGGKRQLLPIINENLPKELENNEIQRYIEPFVGGGAVLFHLLNNYNFKEVIINDYNKNLINLYKLIQDDVDTLIKKLRIISEEYLKLDEDNRPEFYYSIRHLFNETPTESIDKSVYLLFLNKTCFNGLYRVNSKNQFNVPHGKYKNPTILNEENLINVSKKLSNVKIMQGDFTEIREYVDDKTFVYFDPPYRPLNTTSSFTSYSNNIFDDTEQHRLADFFKELHDKKAKLMLSNSDPKNTDMNDNFFENIYSKVENNEDIFKIKRVEAKRVINSKSNGRGKITELLITNY